MLEKKNVLIILFSAMIHWCSFSFSWHWGSVCSLAYFASNCPFFLMLWGNLLENCEYLDILLHCDFTDPALNSCYKFSCELGSVHNVKLKAFTALLNYGTFAFLCILNWSTFIILPRLSIIFVNTLFHACLAINNIFERCII